MADPRSGSAGSVDSSRDGAADRVAADGHVVPRVGRTAGGRSRDARAPCGRHVLAEDRRRHGHRRAHAAAGPAPPYRNDGGPSHHPSADHRHDRSVDIGADNAAERHSRIAADRARHGCRGHAFGRQRTADRRGGAWSRRALARRRPVANRRLVHESLSGTHRSPRPAESRRRRWQSNIWTGDQSNQGTTARCARPRHRLRPAALSGSGMERPSRRRLHTRDRLQLSRTAFDDAIDDAVGEAFDDERSRIVAASGWPGWNSRSSGSARTCVGNHRRNTRWRRRSGADGAMDLGLVVVARRVRGTAGGAVGACVDAVDRARRDAGGRRAHAFRCSARRVEPIRDRRT